jgi:hypothetical protein
MLQNVFGDHMVRRINRIDEHICDTIDNIINFELGQLSCLVGHLPIDLFHTSLNRFRPFTLLRHPIPRLLSLYRFLKGREATELRRLELRTDFTLDELLNSQHPELYFQINNSMVRMLSGDARLSNATLPDFWTLEISSLHRAWENLKAIDFGLAEEFTLTLRLTQVLWSIPYQLREYRENTTSPNIADCNPDNIHRLVTLNTLDLALYEFANQVFQQRCRDLIEPHTDNTLNSKTVFYPELNRSYALGDVPGRQGFYEFENIGLAWLQDGQPSEINFVSPRSPVRLRLHIYCVLRDYPVQAINVRINGRRIIHKFVWENDRWGWLETRYFDTIAPINTILIDPPMFLTIADLDPTTKDQRKLGIAVGHIALEERSSLSGRGSNVKSKRDTGLNPGDR